MAKEVASMFAKIELDAADMKRELKAVKQGLNDMSKSTKLSTGDLAVMGTVAGITAGAVSAFTNAAIKGFTELLFKSPVLAGAFAEIDVAAGRISITLGTEFSDSADLAADRASNLADWIDKNASLFGLADDAVVGFVTGLDSMIKKIKELGEASGVTDVVTKVVDKVSDIAEELGVDAEAVGKGAGEFTVLTLLGAAGNLLFGPKTAGLSRKARLSGSLKKGGQFALGALGAEQFIEGTLSPAGSVDSTQAPFGAALAVGAATRNPAAAAIAFIASSAIETFKNFQAGNLGFQQGDGSVEMMTGISSAQQGGTMGLTPQQMEIIMAANDLDASLRTFYQEGTR